MELNDWKSMLERRGYWVEIKVYGNTIEYDMGFIRGNRPMHAFRRITYKNMRKQIDSELGHGMQHCLHTCGFPILKAPRGYTCYDPFYRVEEPLKRVQYYLIPLESAGELLSVCPRCGGPLDGKTVHRVVDPEGQQ